jgi:hypothetical protein
MSDRYHYNTNFPFTFNPIEIDDRQGTWFEGLIDIGQLMDENPEMTRWLHDHMLLISDARYFQSLPNQKYYKHIDVDRSDSAQNFTKILPKKAHKVKLNFVYNSTGTIMKWYKLLPGQFGDCFINDQGETVLGFHDEKVTEIYRAEVDNHCLIDAGTIHDLSNSENNNVPRRCYSLILDSWWYRPLTWDQAVEIFKPYIY